MKQLLLRLIRWYQVYYSPDHSPRKVLYPGGYCRFHPTCSQYGYQAIDKYGAVKGSLLAFWRILRCNPLFPGGSDPLR